VTPLLMPAELKAVAFAALAAEPPLVEKLFQ